MYVFSDETSSSKIVLVYINLTWFIDQFHLLNTFPFLFPQDFLQLTLAVLINLINLFFESWISDSFYLVSELLPISCFLDTLNAGYHV